MADILIPEFPSNTKINFEKVSKRKYLDVASVNSAMKIRSEDGIIREIGLSMGGRCSGPPVFKGNLSLFHR